MKLTKLEEKVINTLDNDIKAPYEVAQLLRLKRKLQLMKLKDAINNLYVNGYIDTVNVNEEKKIYVNKM